MMVSVVGMGFVGKAVMHGLNGHVPVVGYDVDSSRSTCSWEEAAAADFVFLCLPTPQAADGSCDASIVEDVCAKLRGRTDPVIIKSTVPPGTTKRLAKEHELPGLLHNPEFLSERTALADFLTPARIILGAPDLAKPGAMLRVHTLYQRRFPGVPIMQMSSGESELVKYACNSFYALKIAYFSELKRLSDKLDGNWDKVLAGVMSSGWIAHKHTTVGQDGLPGFGGRCFPKDTSAIASLARDAGSPLLTVEAAIQTNNCLRGTQGEA